MLSQNRRARPFRESEFLGRRAKLCEDMDDAAGMDVSAQASRLMHDASSMRRAAGATQPTAPGVPWRPLGECDLRAVILRASVGARTLPSLPSDVFSSSAIIKGRSLRSRATMVDTRCRKTCMSFHTLDLPISMDLRQDPASTV